MESIICSIFNLFSIRYCVSMNKRRVCLICHCIELLLLDKEVNFNIPILSNDKEFENLEANINVVIEQIKKNEVKMPTNENSTHKKMDMYESIYLNL